MSKPSAENLLITSSFERLSTKEKMEVFRDILSALSEDLERFDDVVLGRELDIMDGLATNVETRLEEIEAVYGMS